MIKQATDSAIELMTGDGRKVSIPTSQIASQRGSTVSLMPEGLYAGLTREEFSDLIGHLITLRQPENAISSNQGMPPEIAQLSRPVAIRPFIGEELRFSHAYVFKPGDVRYGLVYFTQIPGETNHFLAIHLTPSHGISNHRPLISNQFDLAAPTSEPSTRPTASGPARATA